MTAPKTPKTPSTQPAAQAAFSSSVTLPLSTLPDDQLSPETQAEQPAVQKYDPEELMVIFDELLFSQEYTEDVLIKGKLNVRFGTRSAGDIKEISKAVDAISLESSLISTVNEHRSLLNLQYGLRSYGNKDLTGLASEDRAAFLAKLPSPIIAILIMAMAKFDDKVYAACKEGEENF